MRFCIYTFLIISSLIFISTTSAQQYPTVTVTDKQIFTESSVSVNVITNDPHYQEFEMQLSTTQVPSGYQIVGSGTYLDDIPVNGWGNLSVSTSNVIQDVAQGYIAGFIEGVITAQRILQMFTNFAANEFVNSTPSTTLISYMSSQLQWVRQSIQTQPDVNIGDYSSINSTVYWHSVGLLMAQFDGIVAGYSAVPGLDSLTEMDLYLLTSAGDLQTLNSLYGNPGVNAKVEPFLREERQQFSDNVMDDKGADAIDFLDCSALVRIAPNSQDVYFGHTTWRYYYGMMRIYKHFNLQYSLYPNTEYNAAFSSSPGFLSSKDDFYVTGHQLAVMETTNEIFNSTLYSFVIPETLLVWQRAVISNVLAVSAPDWVNIFQQYNSGTYNNQWMVFDYKLFTPGQANLPDNAFMILEQIPGYCEIADVTDVLNQKRYWPSYNIPYFPSIYNVSGYPEQFAKYGNGYSYENCPRATIFNRNSSSINSFQQFQAMMQFNNYENDPLSLGSPMNAISSRADLLTTTAKAFGGVDSKCTSYKQVQLLGSTSISGPTHQGLAPFRFSANPTLNATSHIGLPDLWDFDWVEFSYPINSN